MVASEVEMIKAAIVALKERNGSSIVAIKKFVLTTYAKEIKGKIMSTALKDPAFVSNGGKWKVAKAAVAKTIAKKTAAAGAVKTPSATKRARVAAVRKKGSKGAAAAASSSNTSADKHKGKDYLGAKAVKSKLNAEVKCLAKMVDRDWHDGTEEQGEQLNKYLCYLKRSVKKVFKVCVKHKLQFTDGNDILKAAMDTWAQLQTIPVRGGIEELLETADENNFYDFNGGGFEGSIPEGIQWAWAALARAAAGGAATESKIQRVIADATANGSDVMALVGEMAEQEEGELGGTEEAAAQLAMERLAEVHEAGGWRKLKTVVKKHKMKKARDRRFDRGGRLGGGFWGGDDY